MASILKVDTIQDQAGNNIINENANVITIGASGDTITIPSGASMSGFSSTGIDDNATSTAITINSSNNVGIGIASPDGITNAKILQIHDSSTNWSQLILSNATSGSAHLNGFNINYNGTDALINNRENGYVSLSTNNSERMRIDSSGNVGIGTTSPLRALSVVGAFNSYANFDATSYESFTIGSDANGFLIYSEDAAAYRFNIDSSGNVGIGTSSPTARFDTRISTTTGKVAEFHNSSGYGIDFTVESNSGVNTISSGTTQALAFATNSSSNERMRIDSSGRVGIGTTSPNSFAKLHIVDGAGTLPTMAAGDILTIQNNNDTSDNAGLTAISGTSGISYIQFGDSADKNEGAVYYYNSDSSMRFLANASERMRIDASGNVGIGTTSPVSKLHIKDGEPTVENTTALGSETVNFVYSNAGGASGLTVTLATLSTPTTAAFAHAKIDWGSIYAVNSDNGGAVSEVLWLKYKTDGTYATKEATLGSVGDNISANFYWDNNVLKVDIPVYNSINANITITYTKFGSITVNV